VDANGTRFHLLYGGADWSRCRVDGDRVSAASMHLRWSPARNEITLEPKTFRFIAAKSDRPVDIRDRRGAARDRFGNWYWIAPDGLSVLVRSVGSETTSTFWPTGEACPPGLLEETGEFRACPPLPSVPVPLRGLAITEDHYLVVGTPEPAAVLIFDLYAGGSPRARLWPAKEPRTFEPFALAAREGGGVWILDRERSVVWELDRRFELVSSGPLVPAAPEEGRFMGVAGERRACEAPPLSDATRVGWSVPAADPISLVSLPGRGVLVLDRGDGAQARIHWLDRRAGGVAPDPAPRIVTIDIPSPASTFTAHDFALGTRDTVLREEGPPTLYVADGAGNQAYAFEIVVDDDHLSLIPVLGYFPMRLFGGRALVAADGEVWYDSGDRWVTLLRQNRPRYAGVGELVTPVFDSGEPGCTWHRLMLDACIPPGTSIDIRSRASDDWRELTRAGWLTDVERRALTGSDVAPDGEPAADSDLAPWQSEPSPYMRADGPELPYLPRPTGEGRGTWELLFQRAHGRYLQVRLVLRGDGRSTPRVSALRAWYPRFSYRDRYLPAVYREDAQSASFLDRFLANLEGILTTVEDRIAAAQMLFDVESAPAEALEWLGQWLGVALDPSWEDHRRRLFVRHAMDFFAVRGTARGLQLALRLALDECVDDRLFQSAAGHARQASPVRIIERFRARRMARALLGDVDTAVPEGQRLDPAVRWHPLAGAAELHRRYREQVGAGAGDLPLTGDGAPPGWRAFVESTLGFVPVGKVDDRELALWRDFLARRYRSIDALNTAWDATWPAFSGVPFPGTVPSARAALEDWFEFEGIVLAMHRSAHRFTVMLPISVRRRTDTPFQRRRLELARSVLQLEKPAHTVFDMRFYWAMFRVGEARLGDDTVIGQGSRAPELMAPMVLGEGYLAESFLAPHPGRDAPARLQVGRDRVGRSTRLGGP
jgi:phage tail-like protein